MNWRAADLDARQTAMLEFAEKVTKASAETVEADRQALRDAGFSERDIWDIAAVVGFFSMSNRMASAVGMKPNPNITARPADRWGGGRLRWGLRWAFGPQVASGRWN